MNRIWDLLVALCKEVKEILKKIAEFLENATQKQGCKYALSHAKRLLIMNIGNVLSRPRGAGPRMGGVGGTNK